MPTYQYKVETKGGTPYLYETSLAPTDGSKLSTGFKNTFGVEAISFTPTKGGTYSGGKVTSFGTPTGSAISLAPAIAPAPAPKPITPEQVTPYLQSVQDAALPPEVETRPLVSEETKAEVEELLPETEAPIAPSLVETYGELRTEYGVQETEKELVDLKNSLREREAIRRERIATEEGKPVAMGVISGRVSEVERQEAERIDVINREIAYRVDQLNMSYNAIATIMDLTQKDYQNALASYELEYNQNLQRANLFLEVEEQKRDIASRQRAEALANWQIYANLIKSGNISYANMSAATKLEINKLEVMSGLPVGFTAQIQQDVDADILTTTTLDDGRIQVFYRSADGSIQSKIYGKAVPKSYAPKGEPEPTEAEEKRNAVSNVKSNLAAVAGDDGFVHPDDYASAIRDLVVAGYETKEANTILSGFKNPANKDYYLPK